MAKKRIVIPEVIAIAARQQSKLQKVQHAASKPVNYVESATLLQLPSLKKIKQRAQSQTNLSDKLLKFKFLCGGD